VLANLPQSLTSRLALLNVGPAIAVALRPVNLSGVSDLAMAVPALLLSPSRWGFWQRLSGWTRLARCSSPGTGHQGRSVLPGA
jgi:hypothetical protein